MVTAPTVPADESRSRRRLPASARARDADRSRESILDAAEALFADRGYEGVALGEIAERSGLSRGTPSYFFGSKAGLYTAVLERTFKQREQAVADACQPLLAWAGEEGERKALRKALARLAEDYLSFLIEHPNFVKLMVREGLEGGGGLRATPHESRAMEEAFALVRGSVRRRRLGSFEVPDAVLLLLGLTFAPVAHHHTYVERLGIDLDSPSARRHQTRLVVDQLELLIFG